MAEVWMRDTGDRHEEVRVVEQAGLEQREEVVENVATARYELLVKVTQLIGLMFMLLEVVIGLRVLLKFIGANPASPFAGMTYLFTDIFLWPFNGLTASPAFGNMVFEFSSVVGMLVYALIGWLLIRVIWLVFRWTPTRVVSTYKRDRQIRR